MTDDRLIIEVVYMVFRAAIAIHLSHKVHIKVNKLCFSEFLTGRTTKSPAISLNIIFIHVRFFVRTCKIVFDHHNRRHKQTLFGMYEQSGEH